MAEDKAKQPGGRSEEDLWAAIAAFEQILEIMPNDRASLETLSHAYEQLGDMARAVELMVRLGGVLVAESDGTAAAELLEKLRALAPSDERVKDLAAKVAKLAEKKEVPAVEAERTEGAPVYPPEALNRGFNMADELAFAWATLEANEMSQEEYASVVQDLTEMSAGNVPATVSLLHVLESRQFKSIGRIMSYAAQKYRAPVISLDSFEFTEEVCKMLPLSWVVQRGAIVFEVLDKDLLAVVMNPFNKQTRTDVELMTGRKVHFYMALPCEFDNAVKRMKDALETAQIVKDNKDRK
jgi:tetratricopeptide (TPR) repeat protein